MFFMTPMSLGLTRYSRAGGIPSWVTPGPDGTLPTDLADYAGNRGWYDGHSYGSIDAYLAGASGTFSRGSDATYFDASGILRTAGPNVLRLDHDPATGKALGARLEGARTNSFSGSALATTWTKDSSANSVLADDVPNPTGEVGAVRFTVPVAGSSRLSRGAPTNVDVTFTQFLKRDGEDGEWRFGLGGDSTAARIQAPLLEVWRRYTYTRLIPANGLCYAADRRTENPATAEQALAYGFQLEEGPFASSVILKNTGASATRLADSLTFARAAPPEGTVVIEGRTPLGTGGNQVLWQWDDGTDASRYRLVRVNDGNLRAIMTVAGVDVVNLDLGPVANDADLKVVPSWRAGQFAASLNGEAAVVDTAYTGPLPVVSTLRCGSGATSGDEWFGTFACLGVFDRSYSPAELPEVWA
ncbi:hypothetical protein BG36_20860 [Aquamicrobium defluvii]|uniref:Concanavalin A-like lectin/glucanase superfamily protein n=1 Tax=Aquamicrobium defluvii TaxID=69279 RepID=A0A011VMU9_9HYPH|nr:hypothetical protein BG36_20860 [Aquamicrobium defluvii]EZQ16500.1 hypothetical protein CF98_40865 [Halopseudomonas bauzanensis]